MRLVSRAVAFSPGGSRPSFHRGLVLMLENLRVFIMVPQSASFVARLGELTVPRDCLRKEAIRKFDDVMRAVAEMRMDHEETEHWRG
jgi:hypothetical protein